MWSGVICKNAMNPLEDKSGRFEFEFDRDNFPWDGTFDRLRRFHTFSHVPQQVTRRKHLPQSVGGSTSNTRARL